MSFLPRGSAVMLVSALLWPEAEGSCENWASAESEEQSRAAASRQAAATPHATSMVCMRVFMMASGHLLFFFRCCARRKICPFPEDNAVSIAPQPPLGARPDACGSLRAPVLDSPARNL